MKQTKGKGKVCSSSKEECNSEMDIMLKCKYNYADSFYTESNCPVLVWDCSGVVRGVVSVSPGLFMSYKRKVSFI